LELHCFCSRIAAALGRIPHRKSPILICLDSASGGDDQTWPGDVRRLSRARPVRQPEGRKRPLSARFSEAPAGPGSLQTEFVLVLTCPAQLSTSIVRLAAAKAIATLLSKAPASSSSLQAELVLVLACPAETSTILRKARSWKRREQQARRSKSNRCQLIHFNCLSVVLIFSIVSCVALQYRMTRTLRIRSRTRRVASLFCSRAGCGRRQLAKRASARPATRQAHPVRQSGTGLAASLRALARSPSS